MPIEYEGYNVETQVGLCDVCGKRARRRANKAGDFWLDRRPQWVFVQVSCSPTMAYKREYALCPKCSKDLDKALESKKGGKA